MEQVIEMPNTITMESSVVMTTEVPQNPLVGLVAKLEEQKSAKYDIVVPADHVIYKAGNISVDGVEGIFKASDIAHDNMSDKLEIPRAYYRKMRSEYPELLETNVNSWLSKKTRTKYLLRTFKYPGAENIVRCMLSNSYNIIDNYDVLIAALEAIDAMGIQVEIREADITEKRMYLNVVCPDIQIQAEELLKTYMRGQRGIYDHGIIAGISIANSEVGMGTFEVCQRGVIKICNNGLMDRSARFRKVHLGAKLDTGEIQWNEQVRQKNYELVIAQTKQAIETYMSKDALGKQVQKLEEAHGIEIEHPAAVVERIGMELNISEDHRRAILNRFIKDGQHSGAGIFNAITRQAQHMDRDERYDVEANAFSILPRLKSFDQPLGNN